jgi:hypothetical protein
MVIRSSRPNTQWFSWKYLGNEFRMTTVPSTIVKKVISPYVEVTFKRPSMESAPSPNGWKNDKNRNTNMATKAANQVIFLIEFKGYGSFSNWTTHIAK